MRRLRNISKRPTRETGQTGRRNPILTLVIVVLFIMFAFVVVTRGIKLAIQLSNAKELETRGAVYEFSILHGVTMVAFVDPQKPARVKELNSLSLFPGLRYLYLQEIDVSNQDLECLQQLSALRHLVITSTNITKNKVQQLKASLPCCTVVLQHPTEGMQLTSGAAK